MTGISSTPKNKLSTSDLIGTILPDNIGIETIDSAKLIGDSVQGDLYQAQADGSVSWITPNDIIYNLANPDIGGANDGQYVAVDNGLLGTFKYVPVPATYNKSAVTVAIPPLSTTVSVVHTLASKPQLIKVVLACTTIDAASGYVVGDEIDIESVIVGAGNLVPFSILVDAVNIVFNRVNAAGNLKVIPQGGGAYVAVTTEANFVLKIYSTLFN